MIRLSTVLSALVILVLLGISSAHAASPEQDTRPDPTQGAYLIMSIDPFAHLSANFDCKVTTSSECSSPTRVDYRIKNTFTRVPTIEGGAGYTFNTYFSVESTLGWLQGGPNDRDDSYLNHVAESDGALTASLAVRVDIPITRRVSIFGKYGIGKQWMQIKYDEQGYSDPLFTGNPTATFSKSFNGSFRPISVGLNITAAGAENIRIAYTRHSSIGTLTYSAVTIGFDYAILSTWH